MCVECRSNIDCESKKFMAVNLFVHRTTILS